MPIENLRHSIEVLPPDESRIEQVVARLEDLTAARDRLPPHDPKAPRRAGHALPEGPRLNEE